MCLLNSVSYFFYPSREKVTENYYTVFYVISCMTMDIEKSQTWFFKPLQWNQWGNCKPTVIQSDKMERRRFLTTLITFSGVFLQISQEYKNIRTTACTASCSFSSSHFSSTPQNLSLAHLFWPSIHHKTYHLPTFSDLPWKVASMNLIENHAMKNHPVNFHVFYYISIRDQL